MNDLKNEIGREEKIMDAIWTEALAERLNYLEKEFVDREGYVSCEFSSDATSLAEKIKNLYERSQASNGEFEWKVNYCETCLKDGRPFHFQLSPGHCMKQRQMDKVKKFTRENLMKRIENVFNDTVHFV